MVRSGIVVSVDHASNSGVIEDNAGREFYFSGNDCVDGILPQVHTVVTFVKDKDFKSTNVAMLVKVSEGWQRLTKRPYFPAA